MAIAKKNKYSQNLLSIFCGYGITMRNKVKFNLFTFLNKLKKEVIMEQNNELKIFEDQK